MSANQITLPAYGWSPREDQMPIWNALESGKKNVVVAAHRRFGKDDIALHWTACAAMQRVGTYFYCLPEYSMARRAIYEGVNARTGRTRVDDAFPPEIIKRKDNQQMVIETVNGSKIVFVGSDNYNSLVGAGPVGLVMSEAGLADPAAMAFFRPMLLETRGWAFSIGTPRGRNGFFNLLESHKNNPDSFTTIISARDTKVFTPDQLNQERNSYLQEHGRVVGEALYLQEYETSFNAAIIGAVFGPEIATLQKEERFRPCPYDSRYPVSTSWDLGVADETIVCCWQSINGEERLIDVIKDTGIGLDTYAKLLAEKPYHYGEHFGPHDIANREWGSGTSRMEQAARLGIKFTRMDNTPLRDQIAVASNLIERMVINSNEDLVTGNNMGQYAIDCLTNYRFGYDNARKVASSQPVHDWSSHLCSAVMTYALGRAKNEYRRNPVTSIKQFETGNYPRIKALVAQQSRSQSSSAWS